MVSKIQHNTCRMNYKKGEEIMADGYMSMIDRAQTLDDLDRIVEAAGNNFSITNDEYANVYAHSLQKAQSWSTIK